jgi:putative ABC transport system permease protein
MFHLRIIMMAFRGLRQNLLRSMLATLGVVIGVGAIVAAVSILRGLQHDVLERFETLGADQIYVFNGNERRHGRTVSVRALLPEDADRIERENGELILATAPQFQSLGQIKHFAKNVVASILGTTEAYASVTSYQASQGRFLAREDVLGSTMVCVLGHKIAEDLFGARPAVGKPVKINGKGFIVVGVMEERGTLGLVDVDNQVVIPLSTAMGRLFGQRYLTMLVVQCRSPRALPACITAIKRTLRISHRIRAGSGDDFFIFTQERIKRDFAQLRMILGLVLYSIAGISIVVGAIGIMNIMLVSVTERTREIGVRIAVGARRLDILKQFLTEASIISCFGGGLGVVCGWAIANLLTESTYGLLSTHTPPTVIVLALVMAMVVGIISGIYPAVRASRLDPVEALRYE